MDSTPYALAETEIRDDIVNRPPRKPASVAGGERHLTSTRILDESWPAFLFRGQAEDSINSYRPFPKYIPGEHFSFRGCEEWQ